MRRLSKGEVLFGLGVTLFASGAANLVAELHADSQSEQWIIGSAAVAALGLLLLAITVIEHFLHRNDPDGGSPPDICEERLKRVAANANHLAQHLANFDSWWWAFEHDELPEGEPMPRAQAMDTLLFRFTRFFSAAWIYEDQCRMHRPHDEVVDWLIEVYTALGKPKAGPSDERVMSQDLHAIGEAGTNDWGTAQVRAKSHPEVREGLDDDVFDPLRRFLNAAAPNTEARTRLEAVAKAAKHVTERLKEPNTFLRRISRPLSRLWTCVKSMMDCQP
jgi:hypothetical protein